MSEQLGHSSIELTVKRNGHLIPGANRGFVNNLPGTRNLDQPDSAPYVHPASKEWGKPTEEEICKSKEIKEKAGAGNGIRTRDFDLGKVALYH